jgi:hypothetical protein
MLLRDGRAPPQGELRSEERAKGPSDAQRRWHVGGMYLHAFRRHHRQAGGRPSRTVPVRPGQAKLACLGASVPSRARRGGGRARRRLPSALLAIAPAPTPSTPSTFTLTLTSLPPPRHSRCRPAPSNTPGSALPCAGARPSRAVPPLRLIGLPPVAGSPERCSSPSAQNQTPPQRPHHWSQPGSSDKIPPVTSAAVAACAFLDDPAAL